MEHSRSEISSKVHFEYQAELKTTLFNVFAKGVGCTRKIVCTYACHITKNLPSKYATISKHTTISVKYKQKRCPICIFFKGTP